jgi:NADPH:quinone reductase
MKALLFNRFGGPDVLYYGERPDSVPGDDEVLIRTKAIGLNFADVYRRQGNYHLAGNPPYILGYEAAGVVEAVGKNVSGIQPGDRAGFADAPHANAELVAVPAEKIIPLPNSISFEQAAAVMLQGLTAQYLTRDSYAVKKGHAVLVHAAAGGVGQLLVQICKHLGVVVIGLTSSAAKAQVVQDAGADYVFLYGNWKEAVPF